MAHYANPFTTTFSTCHPASSSCTEPLRLVRAQAYVLKRLVRGLGSGRQGARQGFALALTALLGARPSLSPASVLELMDQHLPFSKSMQVRSCPVQGALQPGTHCAGSYRQMGSLTDACSRMPLPPGPLPA